MALEAFREINLKPESLALVEKCNDVIAQHAALGIRVLTLRQLYYQLVGANVIPNTERSYKRLGNVVSDARLTGLIDWDAIHDRVRRPRVPTEFDDPADLMRAALRSYRLPRWKGQANYVELWVEKDALAGVLEPIASEYHVTLMVNRGYSSQSAMHESAQRFLAADADVRVLLYVGDHDPSGEDMVRDVGARLRLFGVEDIDVQKVALTTPQVRQHRLPPNPAKVTDSRAAAYIALHGNSSWEVDALPPRVFQRVVRDALDAVVDQDLMDEVKEQEETDKALLEKAVASIMKKREK